MRSRRRNAPNVPTSLHRSASASNRRFSLPEKLRRLAIATTSGSRRAASGETISPVALRAPSATVSPEEPDNPSKEDFNNEVMCMSYLYSKLPETGVSPHIDTGGDVRARKAVVCGALFGLRSNNVDRVPRVIGILKSFCFKKCQAAADFRRALQLSLGGWD